MRLWIELVPSRPSASEIVFTEDSPSQPGLAVLQSCPAFVGLGFGDVLEFAYLDDEGQEAEDPEDGIPTARSIAVRSPRRSLVFSVEGKDKVVDEIAAALGQRCLDAGADGEGILEGLGAVCVPEAHSATDQAAWGWAKAQEVSARADVSRKARSALEKGQAQIQWFVTSVPEMGKHAPGMLPVDQPTEQEELKVALARAQALFKASRDDEALALLQRSASQGNPLALVQFMMECAGRGEWGRALALSYWTEFSGMWDECPPHLDEAEWHLAAEESAGLGLAISACARLALDHPSLEPELLTIIGFGAMQESDLPLDPTAALRRGADLGSVNALATFLWLSATAGDAVEGSALFERFRPPDVPLQDRLAHAATEGSDSVAMAVELLELLVEDVKSSPVDAWSNAQTNAGLLYAMSGDDARALELWKQADGSLEAKVWPAVLQAFNGDLAGGKAAAEGLLSEDEWEELLSELSCDCGPWFDRWRETVQQIRPASL